MVAQELHGEPAGGTLASGYMERQEAIYREREGELRARHPDEFIVVCGDEIFVGRSIGEAVSRAHASHPGKAYFSSMLYPPVGRGKGPDGTGEAQSVPSAAFEADLALQREAFMEREDELLAKNPGKSIAVCAGEAFVAGSDEDAISRAEAAHPDRAIYLCSYDPLFSCKCGQDAVAPGAGRRDVEDRGAGAGVSFEADLALQREAFMEREDELLAKNPGKSIAVCAGEAFVAGSDEDAISRAEAAHPDRAIYLCSHDPFFAPR